MYLKKLSAVHLEFYRWDLQVVPHLISNNGLNGKSLFPKRHILLIPNQTSLGTFALKDNSFLNVMSQIPSMKRRDISAPSCFSSGLLISLPKDSGPNARFFQQTSTT